MKIVSKVSQNLVCFIWNLIRGGAQTPKHPANVCLLPSEARTHSGVIKPGGTHQILIRITNSFAKYTGATSDQSDTANWAVNKRWVFFRRAETELDHNIWYRVGKYVLTYAEILRTAFGNHILVLCLWFWGPEGLKTGSFRVCISFETCWGRKIELETQNLVKTIRFEYFGTYKTY